MAISLKHKFTSTAADSSNADLVQPSNWNDEHDLVMAGQRILGRASAGAGAAQELTLGNGLAFDGSSLRIQDGILGGFKNKLINPMGLVNQRGYVSGAAVAAANTYTIDRWRVVTSGQSLSWSTANGIRTFTAPAGGVEQVVEGIALLPGTYVLNWTGTATATVNGTARTKGEPFTLAGATDVTIRFSGGTFQRPQLEMGAVTDFELRHIQQEIALCQRYFERMFRENLEPFPIWFQHWFTGGGRALVIFDHKRVPPFMSIAGSPHLYPNSLDFSNASFANITHTSAYLGLDVTGGEQNRTYYIRAQSGLTAQIDIDAEI